MARTTQQVCVNIPMKVLDEIEDLRQRFQAKADNGEYTDMGAIVTKNKMIRFVLREGIPVVEKALKGKK